MTSILGQILPKKEGMIEDYPRRKSLAWVGSTWMNQSLEQGVRDFKKSLARD